MFLSLLTFLLYSKEFFFFEPYFVFYVTLEDIPSFILIIITSALIALVTSVSVFQMRVIKSNARKTGTGIVGSIIEMGAGMCTSCGQIGFTLISTFGVAGVPLNVVCNADWNFDGEGGTLDDLNAFNALVNPKINNDKI